MADCVDHKKRHVAQGTHLYNVEVVEKRQGLHKRKGIRAVSSNGDPHTFLEGSTVRLSSQQSHTKSLPTYFDDVVQFPQRARVFLNSFEDSSLENLSELVFTGKGQEEYLVITPDLRGTGQEEGEASPSYSALVHVPLKAAIKVCTSRRACVCVHAYVCMCCVYMCCVCMCCPCIHVCMCCVYMDECMCMCACAVYMCACVVHAWMNACVCGEWVGMHVWCTQLSAPV